MKFLILAFIVAAAFAAPLENSNGPVELIVNGVPEGSALEVSDIVGIKLNEHSEGAVVATDLLHPLSAVGIAEAAAAEVAANPVADVPEIAVIPEAVVLPAPAQPEVVVPEAVVLPAPAQPEVVGVVPEGVLLPTNVGPILEAVVLPAPAQPEVVGVFPEAIVLPAPAQPEVDGIVPEAVVLPAPAQPEVVGILPEAVVLPAPAQPEVVVPEAAVESAQLPTGEIYNDGIVQVHLNVQETGYISTVQSWFSMVMNYFSNDGVQTTQQIV